MTTESPAQASTNTFTGACHCKAITYTITLPADHPKKVNRCNCTFCQVPNFTNLHLPEKDFKLLTPASKTELGDYMVPTSPGIHRYFCRNCGTNVFREGEYKHGETKFEFLVVSVSTLDQPQEGLELSEWTYGYMDGRTGSQFLGLKDVPYKSGLL